MSKIKEELEEKTTRILINNDMYNIPVDPVKIANTYGIVIYSAKLPNKIAGAIRYDKKTKKLISL